MRLSAPTKSTFWIATILAALGVLGYFINLSFVSQYNFWFVVAGFVLLWLGNYLKGF